MTWSRHGWLAAMARRAGAGTAARASAVLVTLAVAGLATTGCGLIPGHGAAAADRPALRTHAPSQALSILTGSAGDMAATAAADLFAGSPAVIVATPTPGALATAAADSRRAHAPVFLASAAAHGTVSVSAGTRAEVQRLRPRVALAVGLAASALGAALPGVSATANPSRLPVTQPPSPLRTAALLVPKGAWSAQIAAVTATAAAAGVRVVTVSGDDPRADPAAITALSSSRPDHVLALGTGFGSASLLAARLSVAETGVQLPGGGQVLFPEHRLVAMYGHPGAPVLGVLGDQGLSASIARARRFAARYRHLSTVPVVPAFEVIASVAQGTGDPEGGTYSSVTPEAQLRPWVDQAARAGLYVILDLQAGRADLLTQAEQYRALLAQPGVGLAIDPEWKLTTHQLPLRQIGSVTATQVNAVARWLAALTARRHLPQKLLVLHQFQLAMIHGERRLDTRYDDLAVVIHMDGQGTPEVKQETWAAVTAAAPPGVHFGFKDFLTKDHPMLTPSQTMAHSPQPFMISYQ